MSKLKILDLIFASPLYDNLYVKTGPPKQWNMDFFLNPPAGWAKVKENSTYTKDILVQHSTFLGIIDDKAINDPTDSGLRWKEIGPLFSVIGSHIINNANFTKLYMDAVLQAAIDENVQYLEAKSSAYNKLYVLDRDTKYASKNGKHFIDNDYGELELKMVEEVIKKFKGSHPNFIGYKRIVNSYRGGKINYVGQDVQKALRLYEKYPNLVSGFDLVSEEDRGYSLLFFLEDFSKIAVQNLTLPYFFHDGETNWPDDLMTSLRNDDPVPTMDNLYDAILLGAKRVGHGIGYVKHPYLMEVLKKNKIAVEVNPISNKMLGYVADQRHHPAITYLRYGIPVILGSDDPGTFGYDEFTVDWYEAFMSWGLTLADLRHLALNSLQYSSLSSSEKIAAIQKWNKLYNDFIINTKGSACSESFQNTVPQVFRIFPHEGHVTGGTNIQVFGRNFQVAICQQIICRFGNIITKGRYVYNNRIVCKSPNQPQTTNGVTSNHVPFSVSLDGGHTFLSKTFTFSYLQRPHVSITDHGIGK